MSNEQLRPILESLCQILSSFGFHPIQPEIFFLAKLDRPEATVPLWRLIFEILHFFPEQLAPIEAFECLEKEQLVKMIKEDLFERGYVYDHFHSLDEQMKDGSRALLVCFGWLIDHKKIFQICFQSMVDQHRKHFTKSTKKRHDVFNQNNQQNLNDIERMLKENGSLRKNQSLSTKKLDLEQTRLKLISVWFKNENLFWKWMETVLDQPNDSSPDTDEQKLEAEREKFHAAVDTLDNALLRLEQLWMSNTARQSIEPDVRDLVRSIDQQISSLFNQLEK